MPGECRRSGLVRIFGRCELIEGVESLLVYRR